MSFDPNIPNVARMYDYFLGGKDNFPADRAAAEKVLEIVPHIPVGARENRAFLGRAVRFLRAQGIDQFLDIGTGLPTLDNVHEVAGPGARVVYADNDPQVLVHARALLEDTPQVRIVHGDLRAPEVILAQARAHLDFSQPVAVLLLAIVHFVQDDPAPIVATLTDALAPGGYVAISHVCSDLQPEAAPGVEQVYRGASAQFTARRSTEIVSLFDGLDLVEPGVVNLPEWRPDNPDFVPFKDTGPYFLCGVARKSAR
ncbi:SAM-dependent methyltransferase [Nonomuraea sp. NPDC059194]|uniref:SAM-dependent methyltransferase n=1 Tax=Nonomuraea sp. NPDC059194 TaxID=3346764 RepID=UPI0036B0A3F4